MNVNLVGAEPLYEAERLCSIPICLFWQGIVRCFWWVQLKKGFSSKEMQRQLGLKRYEPVWFMVHKLRKAMANRDTWYTLEGMIEMDEAYFTVESSAIEQ